MMEHIVNTRLDMVAECAADYFKKYHTRLDFPDVLKRLYDQKKLSTVPLKFRPSFRRLEKEAFIGHAYSQIVHVDLVLSGPEHDIIQETNIIPVSKDVFTVVNLPYINPYMHFHNFFEVVYVYCGNGILNFAGENEKLEEGDLKIIAPHSKHSILAGENSLILSINIRTTTFDQVFSSLLDTKTLLSAFFINALYGEKHGNYISFKIENRQEWEEMIQKIFDETNIEDNFANEIAIHMIHVFFGKLLRNFGNTIHLYDSKMGSSQY